MYTRKKCLLYTIALTNEKLSTCPNSLIKNVSRNEVPEYNKVTWSNVITANNVPVQIIDLASGGKLISLEKRDKVYDCTNTASLFDKLKHNGLRGTSRQG